MKVFISSLLSSLLLLLESFSLLLWMVLFAVTTRCRRVAAAPAAAVEDWGARVAMVEGRATTRRREGDANGKVRSRGIYILYLILLLLE